MSAPWRLFDPGLQPAAWQMACDGALLEAKSAGASPDTLRFEHFSRPAALVGFHQAVDVEVNEPHCRERGIEINRRISGGGAVYLDARQVSWELVASRQTHRISPSGAEFAERAARAVCEALSHFGVRAALRGRNDIEVDGRKISGIASASDGDGYLVHGTVLIDFDAEEMVRALRIPAEKRQSKKLLSAADRVTDIRRLFGSAPALEDLKRAIADAVGRAFGAKLEPGGLTALEEEALKRHLEEKSADAWIRAVRLPPGENTLRSGSVTGRGGTITAVVSLSEPRRRIRQVLFTGDFFALPFRAIRDLEASLKDADIAGAEDALLRFFEVARCETPGLEPFHFAAALRMALESRG